LISIVFAGTVVPVARGLILGCLGSPKFDSKSRKFGIRALPRLYFSMSYCTSVL
jgi:hypothetical protein